MLIESSRCELDDKGQNFFAKSLRRLDASLRCIKQFTHRAGRAFELISVTQSKPEWRLHFASAPRKLCKHRKLKMKTLLTLALAFASVASVSSLRAEDKPTKEQTIVEVAAGNKDFSTLVAAVKAAGLVETLSGKGPFTVFAPTNAAFEKLPKGTVETLLKPENKAKLVAVLTYHVVSGKVMAADVVKLDKAKTVQGQEVKIAASSDGVKVNESKVVKTDIETSNGVIHVIDTVLLPKE